jgi:ribosomal protein L16 Arg81 hydroxylase
MVLQTLLGDMPKSRFVEQYFHRLPISMPHRAQPYCELGTWDVLGEILQDSRADVLVARDGVQYAGPLPTSRTAAESLSREGYTVLVRHAERHHAGIGKLAESLHEDFSAPVDVQLYATPAGRHGFGWHFDAEDVFILQTGGTKQYSLRKNTVHPWPLVESIPQDMGYSAEIMPLMRVVLAAGDWLYVPCGYWHKAEAGATAETAISLACGVMSPAAVKVLEVARSYLPSSLIWRQRLPVAGAATSASDDELRAQLRDLLAQLADDLGHTLRDERFVQSVLDQLRSA